MTTFRILRDAAARLASDVATNLRRLSPARRLLLGSAMLAVAIALPGAPALALTQHWDNARWQGAWGTAPAGPPADANLQTFTNQTVRLVVRLNAGGNRVRIRLSNEMGTAPLTVGAAAIGLRASGSDLAPGTTRALTFGGRAGVTLAPGAPALSDPVDLNLAPLADVAVSLYLPGPTPATTLHGTALQTGYVSTAGDYSNAATLPVERTITGWPFLTALEVDAGGAAIVALGDSITDGTRSTVDANGRWTDVLARRLQTLRDVRGASPPRPSVINRGISGNRLLGSNDTNGNNGANLLAGRSALERFDRDVLATSGVRHLVVLIGINDIGNISAANPVTAHDLIAGYRQLIARARAARIAVIGATLLPFEGAAYYSVEKEGVRQAVNAWVRSGDEFDAVIDFDRATRDPARPSRLLPAYDSGDHLHPGDLGYQAMGNAVPLELFRAATGVTAPAR